MRSFFAVLRQFNLLLVGFSQIREPVCDKLQEIIANLGQDYELADIEARSRPPASGRRARRRAAAAIGKVSGREGRFVVQLSPLPPRVQFRSCLLVSSSVP